MTRKKILFKSLVIVDTVKLTKYTFLKDRYIIVDDKL